MSQVNHPAHYGGANNDYEAIKVIEAWELDFCLGNAVKYISRAGKKEDMIQDLKKAKWYIDRKIYQIEPTKESETVFVDSLIDKLDNLIEKSETMESDYFERQLENLAKWESVKKSAYLNVKYFILNTLF
jgi:hypothetical protein